MREKIHALIRKAAAPEDRLVFRIWAANLSQDGNNSLLWPCLVGPTGSGKTSRVIEWAKSLDVPLVHLLLHHHFPEELAGYPRVSGKVMKFIPTEYIETARKQPSILFLDELDKPHPDNRKVILTLLTHKRIGFYELHPETVIVAAMQPVGPEFVADEDGKAIAARFVFLPVNPDFGRLEEKYFVDLSYFKEAGEKDIPLPVCPVVSARVIEYLLRFCFHYSDLSADERSLLLSGTLPEKHIKPFLDVVSGQSKERWIRIAKFPEKARRLLNEATPETLVLASPYIFAYCPDPELVCDWWLRLIDIDPTLKLFNESYALIFNYLRDEAPLNESAPPEWKEARKVAFLSSKENCIKFVRKLREVSLKSFECFLKMKELEGKASARNT